MGILIDTNFAAWNTINKQINLGLLVYIYDPRTFEAAFGGL